MIYKGFEKNKELLEGRRLFLVCGRSYDRLKISGSINNLNPVRFSNYTPNPKIEEVYDGVKAFETSNCNTILAVGGGSPIDVAKCIKYYSNADVPIVAIPTTSGSGSESTHFAVVYEDGEKKSIADSNILPNIVILESSNLENVPEYTRKSTMLDALCHSIESHWAKKATQKSREIAVEATRLILANKESYLANEDAGNMGMMEAANLAGQAINITTTTAAHAMCYKITSLFGLQHGHAAAICLPEVWRYIDDESCMPRDSYIRLLKDLGMSYPTSKNINNDIELLVKSVNTQRLSNSPVEFSEDQLREMYKTILTKY